jgi:hypothetical protein
MNSVITPYVHLGDQVDKDRRRRVPLRRLPLAPSKLRELRNNAGSRFRARTESTRRNDRERANRARHGRCSRALQDSTTGKISPDGSAAVQTLPNEHP